MKKYLLAFVVGIVVSLLVPAPKAVQARDACYIDGFPIDCETEIGGGGGGGGGASCWSCDVFTGCVFNWVGSGSSCQSGPDGCFTSGRC